VETKAVVLSFAISSSKYAVWFHEVLLTEAIYSSKIPVFKIKQ